MCAFFPKRENKTAYKSYEKIYFPLKSNTKFPDFILISREEYIPNILEDFTTSCLLDWIFNESRLD